MTVSPSRTPPTPAADPGLILIALGAALLLVSLFLHWYQPGLTAWRVFEVWDLVLAACALAALVAVAGRLGMGPPRPNAWLTGPAALATVVVAGALVNHPPAAAYRDPMIGLWLALVGCVLMLAGVATSVAKVSVAIRIHDGDRGPPAPAQGEVAVTPPGGPDPAGTQPTTVMAPEQPPGRRREG